jgi:hypothetical protein
MPIRPLRVIDPQRVPQVPRLRVVVVPPPLPRRARAVPPPLPAPEPRRLPLNWKAVGVAGMVGMLLVSGALAWAATHPSRGKGTVSLPTPDAVVVADTTPDEPAPVRPKIEEPVIEEEPLRDVPVTPAPKPVAVAEVALPRAEPVVAATALADGGTPTCDTFGTSVDFDPNPARAAQQAAKTQKLLMVLHVSGNFEDAAFT